MVAGPVTPVQILERAENAWHAHRLPPFVQFTSRIQNQEDPVLVIIRTQDGAAYTQTLPTSPGVKPQAAPGAQLTGPYGSPLGFCVSEVHCSGVLQADPFATPAPPQATQQKTIASLHAYADPYSVTFGPVQTYRSRRVFDLEMHPRFDPQRYQLRDMLVDARDYRVWQLTYEAAGNRPGLILRYDFGPIGDVWYLQFICVYIPSRFKGDPGGCSLESTGLWNFAFPASVPDYYFDEAHFEQYAAPTPQP